MHYNLPIAAAPHNAVLVAGAVAVAASCVYIWRVKAPNGQKFSALGVFPIAVMAVLVPGRHASPSDEVGWTMIGLALLAGSFVAGLTATYGPAASHGQMSEMENRAIDEQLDRLRHPVDMTADPPSGSAPSEKRNGLR